MKVYDFLQVEGNLARLHRFGPGSGPGSGSGQGMHGNKNSNNVSSSSNSSASTSSSSSNSNSSSSSSSSSKPTSFRSRSLTDSIPRTATTTPSWPNSSLCCNFSGPVKTIHDGVNVPAHGGSTGGGLVIMGTPTQSTPTESNRNHLLVNHPVVHHPVVDMNSPEMSLVNRRKAAIASQQNDDSAARGYIGH